MRNLNTHGEDLGGLGYARFSGKLLCLLIALLGITGTAHAQWTNTPTSVHLDASNANKNVGIGTIATPSKLTVEGAIKSSFFGAHVPGVVLFGGTENESGIPLIGDGFRIIWKPYFFDPGSTITNDALVFEKTDFNAAIPDGGFAFVNTGNTGVLGTNADGTALVIKGNNHVGIGPIYGPNITGNIYAPAKPLEINGTPSSIANTGESGLRFRNMNSNSAKIPLQPGQGLLSVNSLGDLIYVPAPSLGLSSYIGPCTSLPLLSSDAGMNLNGRNFFFEGTTGKVGIGYSCSNILAAKLDVFTKKESIGVESIIATASSANNSAFRGWSSGSESSNIGADLRADGLGRYNYGILSNALNGTISNYGIKSVAGPCSAPTFSQANVGIYTQVCNSPGNNYGIYAKAPGCSQFGNDWAGYFSGDVFISCGLQVASDAKLKRDIEPIVSALGILEKLYPKTYLFRTDEFAALNLPCDKQYGLLAQEVEKILPEAVKAVHQPAQLDEAGNEVEAGIDFKSVNYNTFIPILIQGVKEQQMQIAERDLKIEAMQTEFEALKAQMADLAMQVKGCCTSLGDAQKDSRPSNSMAENSLEQNFPNPFSETTIIRYHVAKATPQTYLRITTMNGTEVSSFKISTSGSGQVTISANALAAGTYLYELVVNGEHFATKKMELTK